jgi:hypothetical protein
MINAYRRLARTFEELNLGELGPLDLAIPELTEPLGGGQQGGQLEKSGVVAKWLGNGLQNRHTWVRIPSTPPNDARPGAPARASAELTCPESASPRRPR